MIAWVDEDCRTWSAHFRWMAKGEDGWPERSLLGRVMDEGAGAGHVGYGSRIPIKDPPEAYTLVSVALQRMASTHELGMPIEVVKAHYLKPGHAKQKAPELGVSVKQYWNLLHTAHAFIAGCAQVCTQNKVA